MVGTPDKPSPLIVDDGGGQVPLGTGEDQLTVASAPPVPVVQSVSGR